MLTPIKVCELKEWAVPVSYYVDIAYYSESTLYINKQHIVSAEEVSYRMEINGDVMATQRVNFLKLRLVDGREVLTSNTLQEIDNV